MYNSFPNFSIAQIALTGLHVVKFWRQRTGRLGPSTLRLPARAELFILFAACGFILFAV